MNNRESLAKALKLHLIKPSVRETLLIGVLILASSYVLHKITEGGASWLKHHHLIPQAFSDSVQVAKKIPLPEQTIQTQATIDTEHSHFVLNPLIHTNWKAFPVAPGDNLAQVFHKAGLSLDALQEVLNIGKHNHFLARMFPGQVIEVDKDKTGKLLALSQPLDPTRTLYIVRKKDGNLDSFIHQKELQKRIAFGSATIEDSLFSAGKRANLDDSVLMQLAEIFSCDIDFAHDIHPNDSFKILYEEEFVDGSKISSGNILAVEFNNNGKLHQAIRFTDSLGQIGYFTPQGYSLKRAFIRTPVKFSRISSYFNLQRRHPILHKLRAHRGVDYVAPMGTPVKAVGNGKVNFIGTKGGYGKTIILEHGSRYSTLYAHLSGFARNIRPGKQISQGDIIGYVGSTGLATGPHLHYEFRIDGVHRDPLTVALPHSMPIPQSHKPRFLAHATELMGLMDYHEKIMMASNEY